MNTRLSAHANAELRKQREAFAAGYRKASPMIEPTERQISTAFEQWQRERAEVRRKIADRLLAKI